MERGSDEGKTDGVMHDGWRGGVGKEQRSQEGEKGGREGERERERESEGGVQSVLALWHPRGAGKLDQSQSWQGSRETRGFRGQDVKSRGYAMHPALVGY